MLDATIITSLPPTMKRMVGDRDFGTVYQRACIESWVSAGFRVVSFNSPAEIDQLKSLSFPVTYIETPYARPAITEFVSHAAQCESEFVGIINADCFLLGYSPFIAGIREGASQGLVMVERINIDPVALLPTGQTCLGFDAFFFTPTMAQRINVPRDLSVGQPWWDYWLPAAFAVENIKLLAPQSPLVFHLDHEQGWSQERWLNTGRSFLKTFAALDHQNCSSFLAGVRRFACEEMIGREDLGGFADWCFDWLRDNAYRFEKVGDPTASELLGRILNAASLFNGMHASTLALAQARRDLAILSAASSIQVSSSIQASSIQASSIRAGSLPKAVYIRARRFSARLLRGLLKAV